MVIDGFDRAAWRAPPPTLPVAPVMMSFMVWIVLFCSVFYLLSGVKMVMI